MAASYSPRVWLALATIYVVWGSTFTAITIAVRDVPPLAAMGMRHVTAGTILLLRALPRGDRLRDRIGWPQIRAGFLFGGALFLCSHGGLAWGQQRIPSGAAALLVGSIPLWMALLDRIFFGRRLHRSANVGLFAGFVGLAFLVDPFGSGSIDRTGAVVAVLAAFAWAAGSLYSRGAPLPERPRAGQPPGGGASKIPALRDVKDDVARRLRAQIEAEPERLDLKLKLAERLFAVRDGEAYTELALSLKPLLKDTAWERLRKMGQQLRPYDDRFLNLGDRGVADTVPLIKSNY